MLAVNAILRHREFGDESGRWVIYFHGAPGDPRECAVFDAYARQYGLRFACFERFAVDPTVDGLAYFRCLAAAIDDLTGGEPVDFVGFSIGAFVALQVYSLMPNQVSSIHLVSAAAPLVDDSLWKTAAGRGVFRLAQIQRAIFRAFCTAQSWVALHWPDRMLKALFAGAAGADHDLLVEPAFRAAMIDNLRAGLGSYPQGYARDVLLYVQPWHALLASIDAPTRLWHGELDNWAPLAMAQYLKAQLPNISQFECMTGLSHYSCLLQSAKPLCRQIAADVGR